LRKLKELVHARLEGELITIVAVLIGFTTFSEVVLQPNDLISISTPKLRKWKTSEILLTCPLTQPAGLNQLPVSNGRHVP